MTCGSVYVFLNGKKRRIGIAEISRRKNELGCVDRITRRIKRERNTKKESQESKKRGGKSPTTHRFEKGRTESRR